MATETVIFLCSAHNKRVTFTTTPEGGIVTKHAAGVGLTYCSSQLFTVRREQTVNRETAAALLLTLAGEDGP